jgi:hypothetical protein
MGLFQQARTFLRQSSRLVSLRCSRESLSAANLLRTITIERTGLEIESRVHGATVEHGDSAASRWKQMPNIKTRSTHTLVSNGPRCHAEEQRLTLADCPVSRLVPAIAHVRWPRHFGRYVSVAVAVAIGIMAVQTLISLAIAI